MIVLLWKDFDFPREATPEIHLIQKEAFYKVFLIQNVSFTEILSNIYL